MSQEELKKPSIFQEFLKGEPRASLLLGGLVLYIVGLWLHISLPDGFDWKPLPGCLLGAFYGLGIYYILGLILFILGVLTISEERIAKWLESVLTKIGDKLGIFPNQVIFLILSIMLAITGSLAAGDGSMMYNFSLSVTSWVLGIILGVLGAWHKDEKLPTISQKTLLIALAFFIVGTVIRAIRADVIPPLLAGDEGSAGLSAVNFVKNETNNIFSIGWFSFPSFFYFIQSLFVRFSQTTAMLRFPSAVAGGLTIAAVYLIGKRWFNQIAGLSAAIFMTGFHFHNHFSRIGLQNIWDGLWFILVLGFIWDGWKYKRRSSFIISGVFMGLGQYFYVTSRMLPFIVILWLAVVAIFDRRSFKGNLSNLLMLFLAAFVVVLPFIGFFMIHQAEFMAPYTRVQAIGPWMTSEANFTGLPVWRVLLGQLLAGAKTFVCSNLDIWYTPGTPILRGTSSAFFILGLVLLLFEWKDSRTHLIFLWLAAFVATGGLSIPPNAAQRYIAAAPVCALVVGYSLERITSLLGTLWADRIKLLSAIAIIIAVGLSISDLYFYYFVHTPESVLGGDNTLVAQRLADYLQDREPLDVAFFGEPRMSYTSHSTLLYLVPHITGHSFHHPYGSSLNPVIESSHIIYVFLPNHLEDLTAVMEDYPDGTLTEVYEKEEFLYWMYEVEQ